MADSRRWYLKRADKMTGPFPGRVISDYLLLGRIRADDLLSMDKINWQEVRAHKELYPPVLLQDPIDEAALREARLKVDERRTQRRDAGRKSMADERRKARDRRIDEDPDLVDYRQTRARVLASINEGNITRRNPRTIGYIVVVPILLAVVGLILNPEHRNESDACDRQPQPGIDWSYCKLQGIDLSNQDLTGAQLKDAKLEQAVMMGTRLQRSRMDYAVLFRGNLGFADLSEASLKGVDFRDADLSYANFSNADLSYADLSGANIGGADFTNARLYNTIWTNQKTCLRGSVGNCVVR